jgi:hypothetical protein
MTIATRLLRSPGHLLRRHAQGRGPGLPADLRGHLQQGGLRQALRHQDPAHRGRSAERPGHEIPLLRISPIAAPSTVGRPDRHEYELYLAVENIDHTRTKTKPPDQRDRGATAANHPERVLPDRLPEEALSLARGAPAGSRRLSSRSTTRAARIRDAGAMGRHRCRHSSESVPLARANVLVA